MVKGYPVFQRILLLASLVSISASAQTFQQGPFSIKPDTESLAGITSWADGRPVADAIMYEVPQLDGTKRKLYITPYAHGLCIEYDGVVEFWTEKVSFHNNFRRGGGRAPEVWIGDPLDMGGLLLQGMQTLRKDAAGTYVVNPETGNPYVDAHWTEIVSRSFANDAGGGNSHGDIRYIVRGVQDKHEWRGGPRNAEVVYGAIGPQGLVVNGVNVLTELAALKHRLDSMEQANNQVGPTKPE
jgi:hypothetical protein